MIKRIIFDMDDTLIPWHKDSYITLNHALDKLNIAYKDEDIEKLIAAVDDYESTHNTYDKHNLVALMRKYSMLDLPDYFLDSWLEELSTCYDYISTELLDVLNYLYGKYDLVVLTNWFSYSQIKRLENAGIIKYFSNVYCADTFQIKPYPESYLRASSGYDVSECVMIDDTIAYVNGAIQIGMPAIYYDYKNTKQEGNYKRITSLSELKSIL